MPRTMSVYEAAKARGLWTPNLLKREAKLLALYDYNQAGTVTTASGRVTVLADASGFGLDLTPPSGTGPTYLDNGFVGFPCASHAGSEGLTNYGTSWGVNRLFYGFAVATMVGAPGGYDKLIGMCAATGNDYDSGTYSPLMRNVSTNAVASWANAATVDSVSVSLSTPMLLSSRLTGSLSIVSVNGVGGSGTSYTSPSVSTNRVAVGVSADPRVADPWYGLINKILVGVNFTARDQALVEGWGAWDTNLVSLLPAGHEFKNRPPMNWD